MVDARCDWRTFNGDARYKDRHYMKCVKLFTFPKPVSDNNHAKGTIQCREWIKACNVGGYLNSVTFKKSSRIFGKGNITIDYVPMLVFVNQSSNKYKYFLIHKFKCIKFTCIYKHKCL